MCYLFQVPNLVNVSIVKTMEHVKHWKMPPTFTVNVNMGIVASSAEITVSILKVNS